MSECQLCRGKEGMSDVGGLVEQKFAVLNWKIKLITKWVIENTSHIDTFNWVIAFSSFYHPGDTCSIAVFFYIQFLAALGDKDTCLKTGDKNFKKWLH